MVGYSASLGLNGVYPLGNRDRVIRLSEGDLLTSLREVAQESPTSRRLTWPRTAWSARLTNWSGRRRSNKDAPRSPDGAQSTGRVPVLPCGAASDRANRRTNW